MSKEIVRVPREQALEALEKLQNEYGLGTVRWVVKKNGERVLQQLHANGTRCVWIDVPEAQEKDKPNG